MLRNRMPPPVTRLFIDCIREVAKPLLRAQAKARRKGNTRNDRWGQEPRFGWPGPWPPSLCKLPLEGVILRAKGQEIPRAALTAKW